MLSLGTQIGPATVCYAGIQTKLMCVWPGTFYNDVGAITG